MTDERAAYLSDIARLRTIAKGLPRVREEFLLDVASMSREELQKRVLIGCDWIGHFQSALDGIPEIRCIGGGGIDGCRDDRCVRAIVEKLVAVSGVSFEKSSSGIKAAHPLDGLSYIHVAKDGEWGEFFVREHPIVTDSSGPQYSATFTCNTSFGVYGYHWSSMGSPFRDFAATISSDYLLRKIGGEKKPSAKLIVAGIKKQILEQRREKEICASDAREAWNLVEMYAEEYGDPEIAGVINRCIDLEFNWDFQHTDYDSDARNFVQKLWPLFVRELQRPFNNQAPQETAL